MLQFSQIDVVRNLKTSLEHDVLVRIKAFIARLASCREEEAVICFHSSKCSPRLPGIPESECLACRKHEIPASASTSKQPRRFWRRRKKKVQRQQKTASSGSSPATYLLDGWEHNTPNKMSERRPANDSSAVIIVFMAASDREYFPDTYARVRCQVKINPQHILKQITGE